MGYEVNRYRTTFATSLVKSECHVGTTTTNHDDDDDGGDDNDADGVEECFRMWWGAADANIATGLLRVTQR